MKYRTVTKMVTVVDVEPPEIGYWGDGEKKSELLSTHAIEMHSRLEHTELPIEQLKILDEFIQTAVAIVGANADTIIRDGLFAYIDQVCKGIIGLDDDGLLASLMWQRFTAARE